MENLEEIEQQNVMTGVLQGAKSGAHSANLLFDFSFHQSDVAGDK